MFGRRQWLKLIIALMAAGCKVKGGRGEEVGPSQIFNQLYIWAGRRWVPLKYLINYIFGNLDIWMVIMPWFDNFLKDVRMIQNSEYYSIGSFIRKLAKCEGCRLFGFDLGQVEQEELGCYVCVSNWPRRLITQSISGGDQGRGSFWPMGRSGGGKEERREKGENVEEEKRLAHSRLLVASILLAGSLSTIYDLSTIRQHNTTRSSYQPPTQVLLVPLASASSSPFLPIASLLLATTTSWLSAWVFIDISLMTSSSTSTSPSSRSPSGCLLVSPPR